MNLGNFAGRSIRLAVWILPLIVFVLLAAGIYLVWSDTNKIIHTLLLTYSNNAADQELMRLNMVFYERGKDLEHLSSLRGNYGPAQGMDRFLKDAQGMVGREHGYYSIAFLDTRGKVLASIPQGSPEVLSSVNLAYYVRKLEELPANNPAQTLVSLPINLENNEKGLAIFAPVYKSKDSRALIGMIGAVLREQSLINTIGISDYTSEYSMDLIVDKSPVYSSAIHGNGRTETMSRGCVSKSSLIGTRLWEVHVCPLGAAVSIIALLRENNKKLVLNFIIAVLPALLLMLLLIENYRQRSSSGRLARSEEAYRTLAEEREKLIKELESRNADLERFTYTVSHELKTPLITIRGFLGYLEKEAREGQFERLHQDLAHIVTATETMRRLLDGLVELAKVSRVQREHALVDIVALVNDALGSFRTVLDQRGIEVVVDPGLPPVWGDRSSLSELFQILIENAIKFLGRQPEPKIVIGMRDWNDRKAFFVQDNGTGFDPKYSERIFGLFNKLDPDTEGAGVGLALARRIVLTHGGRIVAESGGPGLGTTILFDLPGHSSDRGPQVSA